jgi:hypothetical protein
MSGDLVLHHSKFRDGCVVIVTILSVFIITNVMTRCIIDFR